MKITHKAVEKLKPASKRRQYADDELTGFGVRVQPDGQRSFIWSIRINGKLTFRKLGQFPAISVEQARMDAQKLIGIAAEWKRNGFQGANPFARPAPVEPSDVPKFSDLVEAYIENHVRPNANSPDSAEYQLRSTIKCRFNDWLDRRITSITVEDMLAVKRACGKKHYAANRAIEYIRAMFNWSAKSPDGKVNFCRCENPAKDVTQYDEESRERILSDDELVEYHKAHDNEPDLDLKDFLTLTLTTGARKSNIFSMRWSDIQWERKIWTVPHPKGKKKKVVKPYYANLLTPVLAVLERRHSYATADAVYVFPSQTAESGHIMDIKKPWYKFRTRAGFPDLNLHDMRRSCGSFLAMAGASLPEIAAVLGQTTLQSTKVYARFQTEALRERQEAGIAKMKQLMASAKKRQEIADKKKTKLAVVTGR